MDPFIPRARTGSPAERLRRSAAGSAALSVLRPCVRAGRRLAGPPLRGAARRLSRIALERWQFDTAERVLAPEAGVLARDSAHYWPSGWLFLRRALRGCQIGPEDVFVDFGSGKGRVVYQAARRYPFKRVVGVEMSESLSDMARRNLSDRRGRLRCRSVEIVTGDAGSYPIPDDMTYAYFFSPFTGSTFQRVVRNILESVEAAPRRVTIIYACPLMHHHLLLTGRWRLLRLSKGFPRSRQLHWVGVYVCDPSPAATDAVSRRGRDDRP